MVAAARLAPIWQESASHRLMRPAVNARIGTGSHWKVVTRKIAKETRIYSRFPAFRRRPESMHPYKSVSCVGQGPGLVVTPAKAGAG